MRSYRRSLYVAFVAVGLVACHRTEKKIPAPGEMADAHTAAVAESAEASPPVAVPAPVDDAITISAVGDCTLGDPAGSEKAKGSFHRMFDDTGKDMARPFSGVADVLRQDDLTIANLEGPLTTRGCRRDVPFSFRGRPAFAQMLAQGSVELVNLANNHSSDCGPTGVAETRDALDAAHVGSFGLGHADVRTIKGVEVVNLGYTGGRMDVKSTVVSDVTKYKKPGNIVIVTFHWGIEGSHAAGSVQAALGHASIDAGADLVIGTHPHVLQGIEEYKGKRIVYSLGNFVFGGNAHPTEWDSMIYRTRFAVRDGKTERLDDTIIPVSVSGDHTHNDFRPVVLDGDAKAAVVKEVEKLSAALGRGTTASKALASTASKHKH